jgi:hypothetical protein
VVSHISRKTSEIWGTPRFVEGRKIESTIYESMQRQRSLGFAHLFGPRTLWRGAPVDSLELGYELQPGLDAQVVANIGAADPKNYIFRDVGRVVRYPLQVAGDH